MGLSPELARLRIVDNTAKRMQMLSDFGFDARPTPKVSQMLLEGTQLKGQLQRQSSDPCNSKR